jgi:hypothetical protein
LAISRREPSVAWRLVTRVCRRRSLAD